MISLVNPYRDGGGNLAVDLADSLVQVGCGGVALHKDLVDAQDIRNYDFANSFHLYMTP